MSSGKICGHQVFFNNLLVTKCGGLWAPIRGKRPVGSLSLLSMRAWKRLEVNEVSFGALGRVGWPMKYLGHVWWVFHGSGRNTLDIMKHIGFVDSSWCFMAWRSTAVRPWPKQFEIDKTGRPGPWWHPWPEFKRGQVIACVDRQKAHDAGSFRVWRSKRMLGVVSPGLCSCL